MLLADEKAHRQADALAYSIAHLELVGKQAEILRVLMVEGHCAANQYDQPGKVQPHHEQHEDREARVNERIAGRGHHERGEQPACGCPQHTGDQGTDQCGANSNLGVGDVEVDERESRGDEQVGQELGGEAHREARNSTAITSCTADERMIEATIPIAVNTSTGPIITTVR